MARHIVVDPAKCVNTSNRSLLKIVSPIMDLNCTTRVFD